MSDEPLLDSTFLFRFSVPCRRYRGRWDAAGGVELPPRYALPNLGQLDGHPRFAELRVGWNERGLYLTLNVQGKRQPPWCRSTRLEDSDGLHLWIDTRDTHDVHRAGRYCHRFCWLPRGGGRRQEQPVAQLLPIHRARETAEPAEPDSLKVVARVAAADYQLRGMIPAAALVGFDPAEQPRLGFFFLVTDRELGEQSLVLSSEFPVSEDPSLWGSLELIK